MLKKNLRILHISCHGFFDKENKMVKNRFYYFSDKEFMLKKSFLLFETEKGEGRFISAEEIKKLLKNKKHMIDLVILQACHSEIIGRVF